VYSNSAPSPSSTYTLSLHDALPISALVLLVQHGGDHDVRDRPATARLVPDLRRALLVACAVHLQDVLLDRLGQGDRRLTVIVDRGGGVAGFEPAGEDPGPVTATGARRHHLDRAEIRAGLDPPPHRDGDLQARLLVEVMVAGQ